MNATDKKNNCHSQHNHHKAHGMMMLLCVLLMVGIPFLILSSTMSSLSFSLLGTALLPLIFCLVMHGIMMKFMMSESRNVQETPHRNHQEKTESIKVEHRLNDDSHFKA